MTPSLPPPIDVDKWLSFQESYDPGDMEQNIALVAFMADELLQQPESIPCPKCKAKVPLPHARLEWMRMMDMLLKAQAGLVRARDKIVIERVIDKRVLAPVLEIITEVLLEHVEAEQYAAIMRDIDRRSRELPTD